MNLNDPYTFVISSTSVWEASSVNIMRDHSFDDVMLYSKRKSADAVKDLNQWSLS